MTRKGCSPDYSLKAKPRPKPTLSDLGERILTALRRAPSGASPDDIVCALIDRGGRLLATTPQVRQWLLDHPSLVNHSGRGWIARAQSTVETEPIVAVPLPGGEVAILRRQLELEHEAAKRRRATIAQLEDQLVAQHEQIAELQAENAELRGQRATPSENELGPAMAALTSAEPSALERKPERSYAFPGQARTAQTTARIIECLSEEFRSVHEIAAAMHMTSAHIAQFIRRRRPAEVEWERRGGHVGRPTLFLRRKASAA